MNIHISSCVCHIIESRWYPLCIPFPCSKRICRAPFIPPTQPSWITTFSYLIGLFFSFDIFCNFFNFWESLEQWILKESIINYLLKLHMFSSCQHCCCIYFSLSVALTCYMVWYNLIDIVFFECYQVEGRTLQCE